LPLCLAARPAVILNARKNPTHPRAVWCWWLASDFSTGFLSAIDPSGSRAYRDILPVFQDSSIALRCRRFFVCAAASRCRFGDAGRPRFGLSSRNTKFLLGQNSIRKVLHSYREGYLPYRSLTRTTSTFAAAARERYFTQINISAYADADGFAEAGDMIYHAGFLT
jgi:hypothetical protein